MQIMLVKSGAENHLESKVTAFWRGSTPFVTRACLVGATQAQIEPSWKASFQFCFLNKNDLSRRCNPSLVAQALLFQYGGIHFCFLQMSLGHRSWLQKKQAELKSSMFKFVAQDSDWHTGLREHGLVLAIQLIPVLSCHCIRNTTNWCRFPVLFFDMQWQYN